jgi:hypothetical protein
MSSKTSRKRKIQKSLGLEVSNEAIRISRPLNENEAFYFYEDIGKPTGESARSLSDFIEKIRSVKLKSLLFHLERKDFQNWIKETLGDSRLAKRIDRIFPSPDNDPRKEIMSTIENRIKELSGPSITLSDNENLIVASSNPQ